LIENTFGKRRVRRAALSTDIPLSGAPAK
jgi:hypothetical protein